MKLVVRLRLQPLDDDLTGRLLRHVGHEQTVPSTHDLTRLQHAFLDQVPYENLEIQLGRPTSIDPAKSAARILRGRGGYCFHLNGTFAALLANLGYEVTLARGKVTGRDDVELGNHMVVMVRLDGETWLPDVAIGDGYRDPVPFAPDADIHQPPFRYGLERLDGGRWRFRHDSRATIDGIDFEPTPVPLSAFEPNHAYLSVSRDSSFVRKLVVQQRRSDHTLILRNCVLIRTDEDGVHSRDVLQPDEWWNLISAEFGVNLDGIRGTGRAALWQRVKVAHDEWDAAGRP